MYVDYCQYLCGVCSVLCSQVTLDVFMKIVLSNVPSNYMSCHVFYVVYCTSFIKTPHFCSQFLLLPFLARSPDDPQRIRVASVFELFFDCSLIVLCLEANFLIFLLLTSSFIVLSPVLLARSPDDPQRSRVVSVFELFSVCLFSVVKFSNFFVAV